MPLSSPLFAPMALTQSQEVNPMKIPHPGELRQLVEIGRTVHEINENGFDMYPFFWTRPFQVNN